MASATVRCTVYAATLLLLILVPSTYAPYGQPEDSPNSHVICIVSAVASVCLLPHCLPQLASHLRVAAQAPQRGTVASPTSASLSTLQKSYVTISGTALGAVTLICLCFYFLSEHVHLLPVIAQVLVPSDRDADMKEFLAGECLWQLSLTSTLFCTLYAVLSGLLAAKASSSGGGGGAASWTPRLYVAASMTCLAFYLTSLPLVTVDRIPFPFEHLGCPPVMYLVFAAYASCVALASIGIGGSLACGFNGEEFEIRRPQSCQGKGATFEQRFDEMMVLIPSDLLAVLAAMCSLTYLICLLPPWAGKAPAAPATRVIYHLAWSYLRPSYVMLFTMYFLKSMPLGTAHPAYLAMSSFGVQYFTFFCALADTALTHKYNKFCDGGGNLWPFKAIVVYRDNLLGISFHLCEGLAFLFSMVLFCWSGIKVQAWSPRVETLVCLGTVGALLVNCISRAVNLLGFIHPSFITYLLALNYLPGYLVIIFAGLWKMLIHRRSGLDYARLPGPE